MKIIIVWFLGLIFVSHTIGGLINRPAIYEGYKVVSVEATRENHEIIVEGNLQVLVSGLEKWHVLLSPSEYHFLESSRVSFKIVDENLQTTIDRETERLNNRSPWTMNNWFEDFRTYDEIKEWSQQLARQYSNIVSYIPSIGKSYQGRDIFALVVNSSPSIPKKRIYIQSLQHAREWVGGSTLQYITTQLITNSTYRDILDRVEYLIVPVVNPDGYEYTWTDDRQWRKSRRDPPSGSSCYGIDLNRNWDIKWAQGGSSSNPCSNNYHGEAPFSEPETITCSQFFLRHDDIIGAIDWHTSGQLILRPYGYELKDAVHEEQLFEGGARMQAAIREVNGNTYSNIHSIELYQTTGTTSDWFYSNQVRDRLGARPYGLTMELTTSHYQPPEVIVPVGEENLAGFIQFVLQAVESPLAPDNEDPEGENF